MNNFIWKTNDKNSKSEVFIPNEKVKTPQDPLTSTNAFWRRFNSPKYRIPSMVITDSGRIVIVCDYRANPQDQTSILPVVAVSDNNGKSWRKKLMFEELPWADWYNGNCRIMDPTLFYYKGKIHAIFGRWNGKTNNSNWTQTQNDSTWGVLHAVSSDNGDSWELDWDFKTKISGFPEGASWLGGVGNAIITKFGTCFVPVQFSPAAGKVSASVIYSNDGINWTKFEGNIDNISESSLWVWVNASGNAEITLMGRRDPNSPNNKYAGYIIQRSATTFQSNSWTQYSLYNAKIPARGGSGCQGSAISNSNENGNLAPFPFVLVSYAANYWNGISAYIRDNITLAGFSRIANNDNNATKITDIQVINPNAGSFWDGVPYGGYSIIAVNWNANKIGIVYEDMLGISYKDLSYLIPKMKYEE